jgi:hypothetical protein
MSVRTEAKQWWIVTPGEARALLPLMKPFFLPLVDRYDTAKYPPDDYRDLVNVFRDPTSVRRSDITRALCWKYARKKLPRTLLGPANRCAKRWHMVSGVRTLQEKVQTLADPAGKSQDFVSRVFLVHLTAPGRLPMIDRFNHRAVRWLLGTVRSGFELGGLPSEYCDVILLRTFIEEIKRAWSGMPPMGSIIDRYLMMLGKHIAPRY